MYFKSLLVVFVFLLALLSCKQQKNDKGIGEYFDKIAEQEPLVPEVGFATGFDIFRKDGITKVTIKNPEKEGSLIAEYYLVTDNKYKKQFPDAQNIVEVPLRKAAVFSGTQLSSLIKTNLLHRVVGVSEASFILDTSVRKLIEQGRITELASNGDFYLETVLKVNPQVIFHSPYKANENHPLAKTKITMIPFMDFKETSPLGRAEWMKLTAAFFGKQEMVDSIFQSIVDKYQTYTKLAKTSKRRPTVFSDKFFNDQWYVPGGNSYVARLFEDAGADYLWADDEGVASFPLDYEAVIKKAAHADFWRIVGSFNDEGTYDFLAAQNGLYTHFDAFKNKKIIWCNAQASSYFENSPLEPHIVLADLIYCFHPELLPDHQPKYYYLME